MSHAIKLSSTFVADIKPIAKSMHRSLAGQVEYWAKVGKIAEESPDLTFKDIREILLGLDDLKHGRVEPFDIGN